MGLRGVVGTVAQPPKPFRLRLRSGHESRSRRINGRLWLGRRGVCVPSMRAPFTVGTLGRGLVR